LTLTAFYGQGHLLDLIVKIYKSVCIMSFSIWIDLYFRSSVLHLWTIRQKMASQSDTCGFAAPVQVLDLCPWFPCILTARHQSRPSRWRTVTSYVRSGYQKLTRQGTNLILCGWAQQTDS